VDLAGLEPATFALVEHGFYGWDGYSRMSSVQDQR